MIACRSCVFFVKTRVTNYGECHRYPPIRLPREFATDATVGNRVRNETIRWGWPIVTVYEGCGEGRTA